MKNFKTFAALCGQKAMQNVTLVTTMWGEVKEEAGIRREEELIGKFWKEMLENGCRSGRFKDTHESAWNIVGSMTQDDLGATLLIQEEVAGVGKSLEETCAGFHIKQTTSKVKEGLLSRIRKGFSR